MENLRQIVNAFTIDVEDYFQVSGFEDVIPRSKWDKFESRIRANTYRFIELLAEYDVKATFFVLGWVAEKYPGLVKEIHSSGHEVGCHSYWHHLITSQNQDEFKEDLKISTFVIEDIIGEKVVSYRAPSFSLTEKTIWALDALVEQGYLYDSSIFPATKIRGGMKSAPRFPYHHELRSGSILEFPLTVHQMGKRRIPVAGGGYFRLFPVSLTKHLLRHVNETERQPFVFYIHPWEIDVIQPRIYYASMRSKFRHYLNLSRTERRLRSLLGEFRFGTVSDSLKSIGLTSDIVRSENLAGDPPLEFTCFE